ncbi:galactokinase [Paenibacillus albiflavus]|uniref:Galactokinase n=1 Tax=Paenibacillus albiflavus TaxID=2545760 RepID=A0A4R4EKR8_9BACL|nr:galactokinase [Paenibacillus albiflavus]TCZ78878.1 galactokinase [Paenibacillus albiflavus]
MLTKDLKKLQDEFIQLYGGNYADIAVYRAPGRVNLIGEHIDYNGGYVFPAALTFGTTLLLRPRQDHELHMASTNFPYKLQKSLYELAYDAKDDWTNFPKGIIVMLQQQSVSFSHGYDMLFHGDIPNGAGLSSSASIEVVTAYGLLDQIGVTMSRTDIALLAQKTENQYVGVMCGIMDQFAVAQGKENHAVLLRCSDLDYQHVPFDSGSYKLIIGNTNKKRQLAESAYNQRRSECEQAVAILREKAAEYRELQVLCELSPEQFAQVEALIEDEIVRRRAKHVVEENARVLASVDLLRKGDLAGFGKLMLQSHASLRDLYEVSCHELDVIVDTAITIPGVLGSRMTGAGFGGCTVSLVHEDNVQTFIDFVGKAYKEQTEFVADFYVCDIGDGVNRVEA